MLGLAMYPQTPSIFAIDSFEHTLNPRLAKKMTQIFCEEILKNEKHVFMITHNPLAFDGLDLRNEDIRLFVVDRNKNGYAQINWIQVSEKLINMGRPLSKLWINGRFEGI